MIDYNKIEKQYEQLLRRLENGSVAQINKAFSQMLESLSVYISANTVHDPALNRRLARQIDEIRRTFTKTYNSILYDYEGKAINLSTKKNIFEIGLAVRNLDITVKTIETWMGRPMEPAIKEVSARVWNVTKGFYKNLDYVLKSGLLEGTPANVVKLQLKDLLNKPEALSIGELRSKGIAASGGEKAYRKLEKKVLNYKPGRGIYKSAKKNAMRLAQTEINRAYRKQDHNVRQKLEFIKGVEVRLSAMHPQPDICDSMAGEYPKDFFFGGWHPKCICYTVPILATDEEIAQLIGGKEVNINKVKYMPKQARSYINSNEEKIKKLSTTPFFIQENPTYFKKF